MKAAVKRFFFENQDYGNRNAHYNEIVEAARDWFDEEIFEKYPTWESIAQKTKGQICPLEMPSHEVLFQAFGGNENNVASHWAKSAAQGVAVARVRRVIGRSALFRMRVAYLEYSVVELIQQRVRQTAREASTLAAHGGDRKGKEQGSDRTLKRGETATYLAALNFV